MLRRGDDLGRGTVLDQLTGVHRAKVVAQVTHHGQVVADEQHREAELTLDPLQEIEDHGLHRDVQRRCYLVRDQDVGGVGAHSYTLISQ